MIRSKNIFVFQAQPRNGEYGSWNKPTCARRQKSEKYSVLSSSGVNGQLRCRCQKFGRSEVALCGIMVIFAAEESEVYEKSRGGAAVGIFEMSKSQSSLRSDCSP